MTATPGMTRNSIIVPAPPDTVYAAFVDGDTLMRWLPPGDMTGKLHSFDAREGGGFELSLFYPEDEKVMVGKTEGLEDRSKVRFDTLNPPHNIVQTAVFESEDSRFHGDMTMTITFDPVPDGTLVTILCENIPPGIKPEDNELGTRHSLEQLARLFA